MDKKLNKLTETYMSTFKTYIRDLILAEELDKDRTTELIEKIYNYERLEFTKEDVSKRKRIKNSIPGVNRCTAKRANGELCTRKQKDGHCFCGTHIKGTPHGVVSNDENDEDQSVKGEVFAEDINGIIYYIDKYNNVYKTEDILNGIQDPEIIAKCVKLETGKYSIPSFQL